MNVYTVKKEGKEAKSAGTGHHQDSLILLAHKDSTSFIQLQLVFRQISIRQTENTEK